MRPDVWIIRDAISLDQATLDKVSGSLQPGSTLALVARLIRSDSNGYAFDLTKIGCNLLILADILDAGSGVIDCSGSAGLQVSQGDNGSRGSDGRDVSVVCRRVLGLNVISNGGSGSNGGQGLDGLPGDPGQPGSAPDPNDPYNDPGQPYIPPTWGTNGEQGGRGGDGGRPGLVTVVYHQTPPEMDFDAVSRIEVRPGRGGVGGPGGHGGLYASNGPYGDDGEPGELRPPVIDWSGSVPELYAVVRERYPELANLWADYRLGVGTFHFRSAVPIQYPSRPVTAAGTAYLTVPVQSSFMMAWDDFAAVELLRPGDADGKRYAEWLIQNRNVLGLPRNLDVVPAFEEYRNLVDRVLPMVTELFGQAQTLAIQQTWDNRRLQDLRDRLATLRENVRANALDIRSAEEMQDAADDETLKAQARMSQLEDALQQLRAKGSLLHIMGSVFETLAVVGVLSALPNGPLIWGAPELIDASNLSEAEQLSLMSDAESIKALKSKSGGLKDLVGNVAQAASIFKFFQDLSLGGDPEDTRLTNELVIAGYDEAIARHHRGAANAAAEAAHVRQDTTLQEIQHISEAAAELQGTRPFEEATKLMLKSAQHMMDILGAVAFMASRALDIYALTDLGRMHTFAYGYIHPDREQDSSSEELIAAYDLSWHDFLPHFLSYETQWNDYRYSGVLNHNRYDIVITDADQIRRFKTDRELVFHVDLAQLPDHESEFKVVTCHVALIGATSPTGVIPCVLEHSGRYQQRRAEGTLLDFALQPHSDIVQATTGPIPNYDFPTDFQLIGFWRRGPAAVWHLSPEPDSHTVFDLSPLTEIWISLGYEALYKS